jgi:hypothetical protein
MRPFPRLLSLFLALPLLASATVIQPLSSGMTVLNQEEEANNPPPPREEMPPVDLAVPYLDFTAQALLGFVLQFGPYQLYSGEEADLVRNVLELEYQSYVLRQNQFIARMNAAISPPATTMAAMAAVASAEYRTQTTTAQLASPEAVLAQTSSATGEAAPTSTPEPASAALCGAAILLGWTAVRRWKASHPEPGLSGR